MAVTVNNKPVPTGAHRQGTGAHRQGAASSTFDTLDRYSEITSKANQLAGKISPQLKICDLAIGSFYEFEHVNHDGKVSYNCRYPFIHQTLIPTEIEVPISNLFKTADIPSKFKIQNFDDPRLYDEQFLSSFVQWVNLFIETANRNQNPNNHLPLVDLPKNLSEFRFVRIFLMLLRDPVLFEKSKEALLGHEICHLLEKNQTLVGEVGSYERKLVAAGIFGGLALCASGLAIGTLAVAGFGAMLSTSTFACARFCIVKGKEIEKSCDLGAIEAIKDASGAIYTFETIRQVYLREKAHHPSLPIDKQGNNMGDFTHPALTSRIAYFREWQNKHT